MPLPSPIRFLRPALAAVAALVSAGCGSGFYPIRGQVVWADGSPAGQLSGGLKRLDKPFTIASTNDPKDTTGWRQWHHWNINKNAVTVNLSKGRNLLTLHIVKEGNMNLGTLEFKLLKK